MVFNEKEKYTTRLCADRVSDRLWTLYALAILCLSIGFCLSMHRIKFAAHKGRMRRADRL
jgi:hypothetical protein